MCYPPFLRSICCLLIEICLHSSSLISLPCYEFWCIKNMNFSLSAVLPLKEVCHPWEHYHMLNTISSILQPSPIQHTSSWNSWSHSCNPKTWIPNLQPLRVFLAPFLKPLEHMSTPQRHEASTFILWECTQNSSSLPCVHKALGTPNALPFIICTYAMHPTFIVFLFWVHGHMMKFQRTSYLSLHPFEVSLAPYSPCCW